MYAVKLNNDEYYITNDMDDAFHAAGDGPAEPIASAHAEDLRPVDPEEVREVIAINEETFRSLLEPSEDWMNGNDYPSLVNGMPPRPKQDSESKD